MSTNAAKAVGELGPEIEGLTWVFPEQHPDAARPYGTEGGVAIAPDGMMAGIKGPEYRLEEFRTQTGVHEKDVVWLKGLRHERSDPLVGIELELMSVDRSGEPVPVWDSDGKASTTDLDNMIGDHPELFTHTAEVEAGPYENTADLAIGAIKRMQQLHRALPKGAFIDPASAWMTEVPEKKHISNDPYVHLMTELLGPQIKDFIGHGIHTHYDVAPENILTVARYLQLVSHLLNPAGGAPYMHGLLEPPVGEIFDFHSDVDAVKSVEATSPNKSWYSVRYPVRYLASSAGGVAVITQVDQDDVLRLADTNLQSGFISNVSRASGPHRDVRFRYDLAPGRVEFCASDNPIGRMETVQAYTALTWALVETIQDTNEQGDTALEKLHIEYGDLFGSTVDPTEMTPAFERTHRNSIRLGKNGPQTYIENGYGRYIPAHHQMRRLFELVEAGGYPLDPQSQATIELSLRSDLVRRGATFDDYYRTGVGTPADIHHRRAAAMQEAGLSEKAIMRRLSEERVAAFHRYLFAARFHQ